MLCRRGCGPAPSRPLTVCTWCWCSSAWTPTTPALADVRPLVEREVADERRKTELQAFYERLLAKYALTIEMPKERKEAGLGGRVGRRLAVRRRAFLASVALVLAGAAAARAHEARPGFLELREKGPETYSFLWKKPTGGEIEIQITPRIPEGCRLATADRQLLTPGALIVRGTLTCRGGLAGKAIVIGGLEATITDVLVRLHHADGRLESHLLRPATPSVTLGGVHHRHSGRSAMPSSGSSTSCSASTTCSSCWVCC